MIDVPGSFVWVGVSSLTETAKPTSEAPFRARESFAS